jgi:hypothetical protein
VAGECRLVELRTVDELHCHVRTSLRLALRRQARSPSGGARRNSIPSGTSTIGESVSSFRGTGAARTSWVAEGFEPYPDGWSDGQNRL